MANRKGNTLPTIIDMYNGNFPLPKRNDTFTLTTKTPVKEIYDNLGVVTSDELTFTNGTILALIGIFKKVLSRVNAAIGAAQITAAGMRIVLKYLMDHKNVKYVKTVTVYKWDAPSYEDAPQWILVSGPDYDFI